MKSFNESQDDLEGWMLHWQDVKHEFEQDTHPRPARPDHNFFSGMAYSDAWDNHDLDAAEEPEAWNAIYMGSDPAGDPEGLLTEEKAAKEKIRLKLPHTVSSIGSDQVDDETHQMRVTPNWTSGPGLEELADLWVRMEKLERDAHEADVMNNPKKRDNFLAEIKSLKGKIGDLSNKIQAIPSDPT